MIKNNIAGTVLTIVSPVAEQLGYMIWDVEFVKEGTKRILRITIDSENGITIDDCEKFHRAIDPLLDEADPIAESYYLEVSSPGVERELKTDEHIRRSVGEKVSIKLYAPKDGKKSFAGILEGADDGSVVLSTENGRTVFERSEIAKIQTVFDF